MEEGEILTGRKSKVKEKKEIVRKACLKCQKSKNVNDYYKSDSDEYSDKLYPICKECVSDSIDCESIDSVRDQLIKLNRPYIHTLWISSVDEAKKRNWSIFGVYMKNVQLPQNRNLTWKNSIFEKNNKDSVVSETQTSHTNQPQVFSKSEFKFNVTEEMIVRWGQNYDVDSYIKLEDFYHKMRMSNKIETPQEETYLKKLAVISLKMDQELEAGNYGQVKQLGDLFSKYMADSKFRAMDKTEADKTGGIRSFSTIFAEVEKDGHIPPWETYRKLKGIKQDLVDKTIMHIENFTLRLNKIERMIEPPSDTPKVTEDGDVE